MVWYSFQIFRPKERWPAGIFERVTERPDSFFDFFRAHLPSTIGPDRALDVDGLLAEEEASAYTAAGNRLPCCRPFALDFVAGGFALQLLQVLANMKMALQGIVGLIHLHPCILQGECKVHSVDVHVGPILQTCQTVVPSASNSKLLKLLMPIMVCFSTIWDDVLTWETAAEQPLTPP